MKPVSGSHLIAATLSVTILFVSGPNVRGAPSKPDDKRIRTISTHDGVFHADEAMACYMLKVLYPSAKIVRSREQTVHDSSDIVVDVGMIYEPDNHRYDHHQQNFSETMSSLSPVHNSPIRLSSAGLIYHHFGRAVLRKLTEEKDEEALEYLYNMMYYALMQEIDGIDNGVQPHNTSRPQYNIGSDLSGRISRLNNVMDNNTEDAQFQKAMTLVGYEFEENVEIILHQDYPARRMVSKAIERRFDLHPSGQIIELEEPCPWEGHVFEMEQRKGIESQIKFVMFKIQEGEYDVQCVPTTSRSYDCRKPFPKKWRGLKSEQLSQVTGIKGCEAAHAGGSFVTHSTREGALKMAIKALESEED